MAASATSAAAATNMLLWLSTLGLSVPAVRSAQPPPALASRGKCLGEFAWCNLTGACTLSDCTSCGRGEYRCPLPDLAHDPAWATCVKGAAGVRKIKATIAQPHDLRLRGCSHFCSTQAVRT